ncbi:TetR family transcriptional regulator [Micromonospora chokoriensis]
MTAEPPVPPAAAGEPAPRRRRDATETRQLLLDAARQRFARDGYAATTVRDIADDAGVNVALISRYFSSKEGLFEACLRAAGDELHRTAGQTPAERVPEAIARHIADLGTAGLSSQLTLLLRSSGDAGADEIRRGVLSRASEQLAAARGWRPGEPGSEEILLRAQMALAAGIGVAVLRSSSIQLEPLSAATEQDLVGPLRELVDALLPPH